MPDPRLGRSGVRWRIIHEDFRRHVFTLERTRRWSKGRYFVAGGYELTQAGASRPLTVGAVVELTPRGRFDA